MSDYAVTIQGHRLCPQGRLCTRTWHVYTMVCGRWGLKASTSVMCSDQCDFTSQCFL